LKDIEEAILNIDIHLESRRNFEKFAGNLTKRRAVERELEIMGEATNNLLKRAPDVQITTARKIVELHNRVIHAYDTVDEIIVWKVIVTNLPLLLQEVQRLLAEE
jgi:uncharacterized protein with HEPN domain